MSVHVGYVGARSCTSGPTDGAKALMSWFLGAYSGLGGRNLGIYNCRTVRGGSTTSLHGEGRAVDLGVPVGAAWAQVLADVLVAHSRELGIQCVIYNRRIWSGAHPHAGWRNYTGVNPHRDHLHVELTWDATRTLTVERVLAVVEGVVLPAPPAAAPVRPAPSKPASGPRILKVTSPLMTGADVIEVQKRLIALGYSVGKGGADGKYGDDTERAVLELQKAARIDRDGKVGPDTRAALARGVRASANAKRRLPVFPLPADHWFGPESSNRRNHSGFWAKDRPHIRALLAALRARGWKNVPGGDRYTTAVERVVRDYQKDAGLKVDGLTGRKTWESIATSRVR